MNSLIEINNVSVKNRLDSISLKIRQGKKYAVLGENGAGKTSLILLILGLLPSKDILLKNVALHKYSIKKLAQQLAYVPQTLPSYIDFSVQELISLSTYARKEPLSELEKKSILAQVNLEGFENRQIKNLSGGEKQRVSIAAALAQQTPILIMDEPCTHLDPRQTRQVESIINSLKSLTVIIVTHRIDWAQKDFDHIIALKQGSLFLSIPVDELSQQHIQKIFSL